MNAVTHVDRIDYVKVVRVPDRGWVSCEVVRILLQALASVEVDGEVPSTLACLLQRSVVGDRGGQAH